MAEGGSAAAVAIAQVVSVGPRHQAQPRQSMGGSRESRPWALRHVMPSLATVSGRLKTASEAAISGLPFTVSFLFVVVHVCYKRNIYFTYKYRVYTLAEFYHFIFPPLIMNLLLNFILL
jgi:hypothetical protein